MQLRERNEEWKKELHIRKKFEFDDVLNEQRKNHIFSKKRNT